VTICFILSELKAKLFVAQADESVATRKNPPLPANQ